MINLFESDEFSMQNMTESINTLPVTPNRVGELGLFVEQGITTTTVGIEMVNGELRLIKAAPRGTMPESKSHARRSLRALGVPHLPKTDTVLADEVQGVRDFGTDDQLEALTQIINQRLEVLKAEHELTWEWHRVGALQGQIKDGDATTVLVDLFDFFGVVRITVNWAKSDAQGLKKACMSIIRQIGVELKGGASRGVHVFCGSQFWEDLVTSTETRAAFELQESNAYARDQTFQQFVYAGVTFEPLHGMVGSTPFVPVNEASAFPLAPIYKRFNAPAPMSSAVNTLGKPLYALQEPLKFEQGTEIYTNSNPLHVCTFPRTLIRVTMS
jgi:hypothetical protein